MFGVVTEADVLETVKDGQQLGKLMAEVMSEGTDHRNLAKYLECIQDKRFTRPTQAGGQLAPRSGNKPSR